MHYILIPMYTHDIHRLHHIKYMSSLRLSLKCFHGCLSCGGFHRETVGCEELVNGDV